MKFIIERLAEPSTYAGFAAIFVGLGISAPAYAAISGAVAAICGAVAVVLKEKGII